MTRSREATLSHERLAGLVAAGLVVFFFLASLDHLGDFPPIHEDENWISSVAWKLVTQGVYGSDVFAGYYGLETHYYAAPPLYHLMLSGVLAIAGLGLFQLRLLPLFFGSMILALAGVAGRRIRDARTGVVAMMILIFACLSATNAGETGIPLLDMARIGRIDLPVAFFGLSAFLVFERGERAETGTRLHLLAGLLIGLATSTHLYGIFWLPSLLTVMFARRGTRILRERTTALLLAGAMLPAVPWWIYVAGDFREWAQQATLHSDRFHFFEPAFYLNNAAREIHRYNMDLFEPGAIHWRRAGAWLAVFGLPLAALALYRRRGEADFVERPVFTIAVALLVHGACFALFLASKSRFYVVEIWLLGALLIAETAMDAWDRHRVVVRAAIACAAIAVVAEGGVRITERASIAAKTTPYAAYEARLHALIPEDTRILGLQHYWIGLRDHPYRSWGVPLFMTDATTYDTPLTLDEAMEKVRPDVVLVDRFMRAVFEESRDPSNVRHEAFLGFERFMTRHRATTLGAIDDPTYGKTEVFRVHY